MERLVAVVEGAVRGQDDRVAQLSAGLAAGLGFLAADPPLAHLLLVEALSAGRPARLEHERSLERLGEALRTHPAGPADDEAVSEETARLLAGGLASYLSGRVLAGQAEQLSDDHELLLRYLLAPSRAADAPIPAG